jgi:asparagine synthase (glutamine-hydrolysing)
MVSGLAASEVTVVLSGDGGDELFAGYDRYRVEARERQPSIVPAPLRRLLGALGDALPEGTTGRELLRHLRLSGSARYLDASTLFDRGERERLLEPEAARAAGGFDPGASAAELLDDGSLHWLSALQRLDLETYLPLDILTKVDRTSMGHSIEARVPLLDHPLVELAARIPPELLLRRGEAKWLFKRALRGWLPEPILARPKQGFAIPLGAWFRGELAPYVRDLLLSDVGRKRGIFRPSAVDRLIRLHEAGRPLDLHLFTLVSFELWCRAFLDAGPRAPAARPIGIRASSSRASALLAGDTPRAGTPRASAPGKAG